MARKFLLALVLMLLPWAAFAEESTWEEGRHYQTLPTPVGTESDAKVEVAEVFWYGCPHCYALKPLLEPWAEDLPEGVKLVYIPAAMNRSWANHARAYYVAESLGELDEMHDVLFETLHQNPGSLEDRESIADLFAEHGIDRETFNKTWDSFGVNAKLERGQSIVRGARITGVPALIINGKYTVTAGMAGSHENMLKVADYLIEKELGN